MTGTAARISAAWVRRGPARLRIGAIGGVVVVVASLCLLPIVRGGWWLERSIVVAVVVVACGALMRMARVPVPLLPLGSVLALLGTLCALFAPGAATWGFLPTPGAISALRELLESGRSDAWATVPPADQTPGLLLIVVGGVGLVMVMVDTLAAGLDLPSLTLLPLAALYLAPWLVGAGYPGTTQFLILVACWLTLLMSHEVDRMRALVPGGSPGPTAAWAAAVTGTLVACLGAASWLPASGDGHRGSDPFRPLGIGLDPIVSLRRAILHSSGTTVLSYRTTVAEPDYLRLAVLEEFDGRDWRTGPSIEPAPWRDPSARAGGGSYQIDIGPLVGPVIPAPSGVVAVRTTSPVSFTAAGLPVRSDGESVANTQARLRVRPRQWTAQELTRAGTEAVTAPSGLDADPEPLVGTSVGRLAREVVAGRTNPFEQAVALQDWFTTSGGFRYSTAVAAGEPGMELSTFLDDRTGYCEQFAATMAVMARSLGIPARVVVGFTPGRLADDVWTVRDSDAHAWPELWIGSAGWVRFEPTPRTDAVSTPAYARPDDAPTTEPEPAVPEPSASQAPTAPEEVLPAEAEATGTQSGSRWPVVLLLAVLVGPLLGAPGVVRWRRRRRRVAALAGPGAGSACYQEVVDTLVDTGLGTPGTSEAQTLETVRQVVGDARVGAATARIAAAVERERYGPPTAVGVGIGGVPSPGGSTAWVGRRPHVGTGRPVTRERASDLADDLRLARSALLTRAGRLARLRARVLPRSLWR